MAVGVHRAGPGASALWRSPCRGLSQRPHHHGGREEPPQILCVDPRPTPVAEHATLHLAPRPGTNLAPMNGLIHELLAAGHVDRNYVDEHTVGYASLEQQVADYPPERVAEICDVPAEQISEAARLIGGAERLMTNGSAGLLPVQSDHGGGGAGQQHPPGRSDMTKDELVDALRKANDRKTEKSRND